MPRTMTADKLASHSEDYLSAGLTQRECEAVQCYDAGFSLRQTAIAMDLSASMCHKHLRRGLRKLASADADEIQCGADDAGWIEHAVRGDVQERVILEAVRTVGDQEVEEYAVIDYWRAATLTH